MKFIVRFILVCVAGVLSAQESLPTYQQYLLGGQYLLNPAHYGATDDVVLHGTYHKQFAKAEESPNVQTIGLHANVVDRLGVGLAFFRDQNGPISANGITVGVSYFIPLSDDGDRKDQFSFGTAVNFYNMNVDLALLNPQEVGDPLFQDGTNSVFMAYNNIGAQFSYRNFFGGLSVLDIPLTSDRAIVNGIEPTPTKYLLNAGYDWQFAEGISVEPSILLNLNTNSSRMMDVNLLAKFFNDTNLFAAGVSFRAARDQVGGQQLSLSPIIKGTINRFTFGASYSFGMSEIHQHLGNGFALSIGYNFENFINTRGFR